MTHGAHSFSRKYLALFLGVYLMLAAGGWLVYSSMRDQIRQHVEADLKAVGEMKKLQIEAWLKERFGDAKIFGTDSLLASQVATVMQSGRIGQVAARQLVDRMNDIVRVYHYSTIALFDPQGRLMLSTREEAGQSVHGADARLAVERQAPVLVDLHAVTTADGRSRISLGVMQPIFSQGRVVGCFYFEVEPEGYLYPMIQSWPEDSETAESQLLRKDDNHVLYLNKLRHRQDEPLTLRVPLSRTALPAVQAALGHKGIVSGGSDYRNEPVLAYLTEIERTPWKMVSKIDEREALGPIHSLAVAASVAMLALLIVSTWMMRVWLRRIEAEQTINRLQMQVQGDQLLATVQAIPDVLFEMDVHGHFYAVYDAQDRMFSTPAESLLNHNVADVMPPQAATSVLAALRAAAERGSSRGMQIRLNVPEGVLWIELSVARKATQPGGPQRLMVISRNITEQKKNEAELERHRAGLQEMVAERTAESVRARMEAEHANQAKSLFLANMSHEIRTPMHAILSFAKLGMERSANLPDPTVQKMHQFFDRISQSASRLLLLLNDLLDLSKLEAGRMVLESRRNDIGKLILEVCEEQSVVAQAKEIVLDTTEVASGVMVRCDRMRVGQVMGNLLGNAIKFSPERSTIHIRTQPARLDNGGVGIAVRVEDAGPGIPTNELETVFETFVQSSKTATGAGGTGLGLSISREIVMLHGGTIHAENNPHGGASLVFTLPVDLGDADASVIGEHI